MPHSGSLAGLSGRAETPKAAPGSAFAGDHQYLFLQIRSKPDSPRSPTSADSDQRERIRNSKVKKVRSGGCPGAGVPSARVRFADTFGEICTTSSGRALPVLVSTRVLTSSAEMLDNALLR